MENEPINNRERRKSRKSIHDVNQALGIRRDPEANEPNTLEVQDETEVFLEEIAKRTARHDDEIVAWKELNKLDEPLPLSEKTNWSTPKEITDLLETEKDLAMKMANQSAQRKRVNLLEMFELQCDKEKENYVKRFENLDYDAYCAQF